MAISQLFLATLLAAQGKPASDSQLTVSDVQVTLIADVQAPARQPGILSELFIKEGDLVANRSELGRLDSELASIDASLIGIEFEIARLRAENDIDRRFARKSLDVAKSELARSLESVTSFPKSISKSEIDRLQLVVEKTDLSIEQSERDLKEAGLTKSSKEQSVHTAKKRLDDHRITAPTAGMVVEVFRQPGEWLNQGDPVVRIIRLDRLRVEAFVDGSRYGANLMGCPVVLTTNLPPGDLVSRFEGAVTFVSPEVQPVNGQVLVWADVENPQLALRPGVRGKLAIDLSRPATPRTASANSPQAPRAATEPQPAAAP